MVTPSSGGAGPTGPWQGGFPAPTPPPALPDLDTGSITIVSQGSSPDSGTLVRYAGGVFTSQSWSTGPPVPLLIEVLQPDAVSKIRHEVTEQLHGPGTGLDDIPLHAFAEAARLYLETDASDRFTAAAFGMVTQPSPGEFLGTVTWPGGVVGMVLASGQEVSAQTHLAPEPAGNLTPLREADLRSLVQALEGALGTTATDPRWQQVLSIAQQALP
jgi:hypothetical protein